MATPTQRPKYQEPTPFLTLPFYVSKYRAMQPVHAARVYYIKYIKLVLLSTEKQPRKEGSLPSKTLLIA